MKLRNISLLAVIAVTLTLCACGSKHPDLQALYDEYCLPTWAEINETLGENNYVLSIDTNPNNDEGVWSSAAYDAIININAALGLPESLNTAMEQTTALDEYQEEQYENKGINVAWTYYPANGLEVMYGNIIESDGISDTVYNSAKSASEVIDNYLAGDISKENCCFQLQELYDILDKYSTSDPYDELYRSIIHTEIDILSDQIQNDNMENLEKYYETFKGLFDVMDSVNEKYK